MKSSHISIIFQLISIYFLLFLPSPVYSQTDSLLKYLEIAAGNNPAVLQKLAEYEAALQKVPQAGSLPDPVLSAGIFLKPMELVSGKQVADLELMQMFPWFGVLKSAKDEMSLMANARYALMNDTRLQVSYDVQRSWYELAKIRNSIAISERNIEILRDIEKMALIRFQFASARTGDKQVMNSASAGVNVTNSMAGNTSGMQNMGNIQNSGQAGNPSSSAGNMPPSSMGTSGASSGLAGVYNIQIEAGELQNIIEGLKNQEKTVIARFNGYLNRPSGTPVFTLDTLPADTLSLALFSLNDSLLINNPMLQMLDYEKQSAEARKRMNQRMGYPMVGLGLNYSIIGSDGMSVSPMNGKDMLMPMVSVTLPVFRKKYKATAGEAEWLKTSITHNYRAMENSIRSEYYQAVQQYNDALRSIRLYGTQTQLALKSYEIVLKSFASSSSDLTDLLRIRQQVYDYELKRIGAKADLYTAKALIQRLTAVATPN